MNDPIFHMCRAEEWQTAQETGQYPGSSQDQADGFIHFSTADQIVESAAKHRTGQSGLLLLTVAPETSGRYFEMGRGTGRRTLSPSLWPVTNGSRDQSR